MTSTPIKHDIIPLNETQLGALVSPLNPNRVASRSQGGRGLSYLKSWDVKRTLIRVFGFGGFSVELMDSNIERIFTKAEIGGNANWTVLATATVKLTIHQLGAVYTEAAASSQAGSQIGEVTDFALKTAESDALKRAASYLGTQFGLSLYDDGSTNDVVNTILSDEQRWPRPQEQAPAPKPQGAIDGPQVHPGAVEAARRLYPQPAEGVTPEQYEANLQLLGAAMQSKASRDGDQRPLNDDEIMTVLEQGSLQPQQ